MEKLGQLPRKLTTFDYNYLTKRTFDAVCGIYTGDFIGVFALRDAINAGHKNIFIKDGNYSLAGDITIPSNTLIQAQSRNTVLDSVANGSLIIDPSAQNIEFNGFSLLDSDIYSNGGDVTLSPGVYCGGISISGSQKVNFEPGVYIMDGGSFDVSGPTAFIFRIVPFFPFGHGSNANSQIFGLFAICDLTLFDTLALLLVRFSIGMVVHKSLLVLRTGSALVHV